MEKTEMMKKFEAETGKQSAIVKFMAGGQAMEIRSYPRLGVFDYSVDYISWLESKASAYDRLMSGGRKTLKEWANFLGKCFAVDPDGFGYSFGSKPIIKDEHWWPDGDRIAYSAIRPDLIDFNGDWKDSLTLPDGWEEE